MGVTLFVNWGIKPFSMVLLGVLFREWLPAEQIGSYIAGLIPLAAAPCTAIVFVWSYLMRGEPYFTLSQVALNDVIMVFAFAPLVGLLPGLSAITVPWDTLLLSVFLYIVTPLVIASLWQRALLKKAQGYARLDRTIKRIQPLSLGALLATLVLLFGFQGGQIISAPLIIALLAVAVVNRSRGWYERRAGVEPHEKCCPPGGGTCIRDSPHSSRIHLLTRQPYRWRSHTGLSFLFIRLGASRRGRLGVAALGKGATLAGELRLDPTHS